MRNSKKHIINIKDFEDYISESRLAGSHGKGINKTLDMYVHANSERIWFVVRNHRKEIGKSFNIKEAIEIYNNL
jgi:hypothetical protein